MGKKNKKKKKKKKKLICQQCGDCCRCTLLVWEPDKGEKGEPEYLRKVDLDPSDKGNQFVLKYWKRISREIAKKMNPYLYASVTEDGDTPYFYMCTKLKNGICTDYGNRPKLCRKKKAGDTSFNPYCGDLKKALRPDRHKIKK